MNLTESVRQILAAREVFGELFYEELFRICPEAKPLFGGSDMQRQSLLVTMTLTTVQQYHDGGYPAVEHYLKHLGTIHARKAVPHETYSAWRKAMLTTLRRLHGEEWSTSLAREWTEALDKSWSVMVRGEEERKRARRKED